MTDVSLVYAFAAFNFPYEFSGKLVGATPCRNENPACFRIGYIPGDHNRTASPIRRPLRQFCTTI